MSSFRICFTTHGWTQAMLRCALVSMVTGSGVVALPAAAQDDDGASLRERLDQLEAAMTKYRSQRAAADTGGDDGGTWLTGARAGEVRALVQDVLGDADSRASLLQDESGAVAGWDGHPFLASADGNFSLQIEGRSQWRYIWNGQEDVPGIEDTTRSGFENRRIRAIFSGHVVDPSITYKVQATYSREGGGLALEDAFVQKELESGMYVQAGQARPPFTREVNVSTFRTTAVERGIAHGAIEVSRSQGVEVGWSNRRSSLRGMFHDGDGLANTPALMEDTEYAFSVRGEYLIAGEWSQFNDFTSWRDGEFGILLGAGAHYERSEFGTASATMDDWRWTADLSAEMGGCHLYGALGGRHIEADDLADMEILIAVVQGGVFLTDHCEVFGRLEWGDDDADASGGDGDLTIITAGVTRFWKKHDLKWMADIGYAFEPVSATFASSGAGWRQDPPDADGQIVVRSQVQLSF